MISDDLRVLEGKHVLIVEDIIDTGNTLQKFCKVGSGSVLGLKEF